MVKQHFSVVVAVNISKAMADKELVDVYP